MRGLFVLVLVLGMLFPMAMPPAVQGAEPVRVGIYQNRPGAFVDEAGVARGFYIDLLEEIARNEGWPLTYVSGSWSENLRLLEQGKIDLLVAAAFTEEREKRFDFTIETALANWGQLYVRDPRIQSILDLEGRHVVGMEDDIYTSGLRSLLDRFDIKQRFSTVPEYARVLQQVAEGQADAGIVSRIFGLQNDNAYAIQRSTIVCCPVGIRFAAPNGRYEAHLRAIDRHLVAMKADKGSFYYRALDRWFGLSDSGRLPVWLWWSVILGCVVLLAFVLVNLYLRRQVRSRTAELAEEIAERQRIDLKLKESYRSLEKKARDLEDAREAAELANRAKSEFLANVTHELHTPMNAIRGMTELALQLEDLPPKAREFLSHVYVSSRSLMKVIDDILNYSRVGSGRTRLNVIEFDLGEVFRSLLDFSKSAAGYKRIGMVMSLPREIPRSLVGDVGKLNRVLTHLVDNALKFTEQGGIRVQCALVEQTPERVRLRFQVQDTGIGITEDQMPHIFDSFVQGDGSTTRRHGGTGIGLALCKSFVELMEGRIWVESVPERGSTFFFTAWFNRGSREKASRTPLNLSGVSGKAASPGPVSDQVRPVKLEPGHVALLQSLSEALNHGDVARAESRCDAVRTEMAALIPRGELKILAEQVDDFDFHRAQKTLAVIADLLGVPLQGEAG